MEANTDMPAIDVPRLALSFEEAAQSLSLSERTLRRLMQGDGIPHFRVVGRVLFPVDGLRRWIAEKSGYELDLSGDSDDTEFCSHSESETI